MRVVPNLTITGIDFMYGGGTNKVPQVQDIVSYIASTSHPSYRINFTETLNTMNLHMCFLLFFGELNADL